MADQSLIDLATTAYIFGYALVYDVTEVRNQTTSPQVPFVGPVNLFGHATSLSGPDDNFVTLNNDTLYSVAHSDLSAGPLVLHVPDTSDRYYVMQCIDPWSNNFAYIGRRATGTAEGTFLFTPPGWIGETPVGMTRIAAPNTVFTINGRYAVSGADDLAAVKRLQEQTWLTPLSRYPEPPQTEGRTFGDWDIAPYNDAVPEALRFWEQFRAWMARFPPPAADQPLVQTFAPLGLLGGPDTYLDPDPALCDILLAAAEAGQARVEALATEGTGDSSNGWLQALHSFDFNMDRLELGTIDSPEWVIADRNRAYEVRAGAARGGLWGNHGYEADYAFSFVDDQGAQLTGEHRYVIHFATTPPVDAFWSLTMYDAARYYLVANPINRYSIGDRTPGVQYNADGSLDLYLQHESPGSSKESNWLPTPEGAFRPILRMYQPQRSILDGSYVFPPITRI
ncbi:MAG: DUF1214 domain-containing protein [Thermomicrobiales bacterium]